MDILVPEIAQLPRRVADLPPHAPGAVENIPTVIVKDGHVIHASLDRAPMSMAELRPALCSEGIATMSEARYAIVEGDGHVIVTPARSVLA